MRLRSPLLVAIFCAVIPLAAQDQPPAGQVPPPAVVSEPAPQLPQEQPASEPEFPVPEKEFVQGSEDAAAPQNESDNREDFPPSRPRGHGGALPK